MAMSQSNLADRPRKPRADFPLFPHENGQWAKKVKDQFHYFGSWSDPDGAVERYGRQRDDLYAGRKSRPHTVVRGAMRINPRALYLRSFASCLTNWNFTDEAGLSTRFVVISIRANTRVSCHGKR
jgi:hypothetical protein